MTEVRLIEVPLHHAVLFAVLFMLIAFLTLTWPSPCIQALYNAVLLAAVKELTAEPPKQAPSTTAHAPCTGHQAQSTSTKHQTEDKHQAHQHKH